MALQTSSFMAPIESKIQPKQILSDTPRPAISFHPDVMVHFVLHIDDYTDDEVDACWYNRSELKSIKSKVKTTIALMNRSSSFDNQGLLTVDNDHLCTRGLESFTAHGVAMKQHLREEARYAVFEEQDLQDEEMSYDPEAIADIYFEKTQSAQVMATAMGRADEEWVRQEESKPGKKFIPQIMGRGFVLPPRAHPRLCRVSSSAA